MHTCFERYAPALRALIAARDAAGPAAGASPGQVALLALVGEFYESVQQKLKLAVDRLLCLHIAEPPVVVAWLLSSTSSALRLEGAAGLSTLACEILMFTVQRAQRLPSELPAEVDALRRKHAQLQVTAVALPCVR